MRFANKKGDYVNGRPGVSDSIFHSQLVATKEWEFGHPTNIIAEEEGFVTLLKFATMYPNAATSGHYVSLLDNTSTQTNGANGGIAVTTQATPTDNDDMALGGTRTLLMATNQAWLIKGRLMVASAANLGFTAGFDSSAGSAEIFTADPTDGIFLIKPKNSADVILRVVANGGAAVDLAVFNLTTGSAGAFTVADSTQFKFYIKCFIGTDAATTSGEIWLSPNLTTDPVRTPFTAAQNAALWAMVNTTAPTLRARVSARVNGTTQRRADFTYIRAEVAV